ncbi:MAG: OmpA family protein [Magnetococcales bacterium]|nr:OmpA family protein [Magnetococcales bacterium]
MKITNYWVTVLLLSASLVGCASTSMQEGVEGSDVEQSPHATATMSAMAKGDSCYFRGQIDFCYEVGDADGDGVKDDKDQCPDTPRGTKVDAKGCPLDSDGDGVIDDQDRCPNTPSGAKVNRVGCWVLENLHFEFNKFVLSPDSYPLLDDVVKVLNKNPSVRVELQGHTDNKGTPEYNDLLSKKRAASVQEYLIAHGIAADRLTSTGFGLTQPLASNEEAEGRAKNRRVELKPLP